MKMTRRLLSLLLTLGILLSLSAGLSVTAFAEDGDITLSFSGAEAGAISGTTGDAVTLPSAQATQAGYSFLGWTTSLVETTENKPTYLKPGSSYSLSDTDETLYALYSYVDHNGTPSVARYVRVTAQAQLEAGSYLIGCDGSGLLTFNGGLETPNTSGNFDVFAYSDTYTVASNSETDACTVWIAPIEGTDYYSMKLQNGSGKYFGTTGSSTGITTKAAEPYPTAITIVSGYAIIENTSGTNIYNFRFNNAASSNKFAFYKPTTGFDVSLYKKLDAVDGTLYYTGTPLDCDHEGTQGVVTDPTCTENGFETFICATCGYKWVVEGAAAIGHDYTATVIDPTATTQGYTSYVCNNCGDTYQDSYVDPFGTEYQVTYNVLGTAEEPVSVNSFLGTELPTPSVVPDGYTFAGWATSELPEETDTAAVLTGTYKPTSDVTLYAVYSRGETFSGSGDYVKVTAAPDTWNGQYLVVYEGGNIAFNSNFGTTATNLNKAGNYLPVTISNSTIAATEELDAAAVTIAPVSGTSNYSIKTNAGLMIGSTGSTSGSINAKSGTIYQSTITLNSNYTVVIANVGGTNTLNFAYNSSTANRFAYWTPTTKTVCAVCLYQKQTGGTTLYYTTAPATAGCEHETTETVVTAPTCTDAGYTTHICTNCGYKWTDTEVAALGHDYDEGVVTAATPTAYGYTTYTCQREGCGDSYQADFTGYEFSITFNVLGEEQEPVAVDGYNGIQLPTEAAALDGYKFVGWAEEEIVGDASTADVLTGLYKPVEDATLFAVYCRKQANEGSGDYYKVTAMPLVSNGNYLLVNEEKSIAFKAFEEDSETYDLTKAENYFTVSISDNTIPESAEADFASIVINPIEGTANYAMTVSETGAYLGTTGSGTGFNTRAKEPYETAITVDASGNAVITNVGGTNAYQLLFNTASNSNKFGFFKASNTTCEPIALYCKDGSGYTNCYTTRLPIVCAHENTELKNAADATCTKDGYTGDAVCSDCGEVITAGEVIPALGHNYQEVETIDAECTEEGSIEWECSVCGTTKTDPIPALGHDFIYTNNGANHTVTCSRCNYSVTEAHEYTDGMCVCGAENVVAGLKITSAALVLNGKIDVVYTAEVPTDCTNARMVFTGPNGDMTVTDYTVNADGNYCFTYTGINPQCMGDNISATLYATKNGTEESVTKDSYSVRQYCVNKLADETVTGALRTLLSDILAYGAAAQTYANYKTDALVTSGSDIKSPAYSTFPGLSGLSAQFDGTAAADTCWSGVSLTLTDGVAMNFRFYAENTNGLSVQITMGDRTETFTEFNAIDGMDNVYEVSFEGIKATEFSSTVTAKFYRNNAQIGNAVSYSVNTYVCAKQNDSNTLLAELVQRLYNYGVSAASYAN